MKQRASAPANLALIKYMGKRPAPKAARPGLQAAALAPSSGDFSAALASAAPLKSPAQQSTADNSGTNPQFDNLPLNDSLSFTLNHFIATAEIERREEERPGAAARGRPGRQAPSARTGRGGGATDPAGAGGGETNYDDDEWRPLEEAGVFPALAEAAEAIPEKSLPPQAFSPGDFLTGASAEDMQISGRGEGRANPALKHARRKEPAAGAGAKHSRGGAGAAPFFLSPDEQKRFLDFFRFLKKTFRLKGSYIVRSGANFPPRAGLAGSAAAFAALTSAAGKAAGGESLSKERLSCLSRAGSGSSCRSFFSPWALWSGEGAKAVNLPGGDRIHRALILKEEPFKKVSSSEAHQRVWTSPLFSGRAERAQNRLSKLLKALKTGRRGQAEARAIVWEEFEDMHRLFETADPPFSFREAPAVQEALHRLDRSFAQTGDGPLVTMDAGPSIHLLFRKDQEEMIKDLKKDFPRFQVLPGIYDTA